MCGLRVWLLGFLIVLGFVGCQRNKNVTPISVVSVSAMADAEDLMPIPVMMYLFDGNEIESRNFVYGPAVAIDSAYGQVWRLRLPPGNYRVEVFDGHGVMPSGENVHWMNGVVDFSAPLLKKLGFMTLQDLHLFTLLGDGLLL